MRISDWSSDVCSSDLLHPRRTPQSHPRRPPSPRPPAHEDGKRERAEEHAVADRGGQHLPPHLPVRGIGMVLRPVQRNHERGDRQHQAGQVEEPAPPVPRLARKQPEQHAQDQEPGQEQDQAEVEFDLRAHAASSAANRARVATTSSSATPSASSPTTTSRSEEHTSELQSLMRISYAVFCLKKKNSSTT